MSQPSSFSLASHSLTRTFNRKKIVRGGMPAEILKWDGIFNGRVTKIKLPRKR